MRMTKSPSGALSPYYYSVKIKEMRLAATGILKFEVTNFVPMGYDNYRFVIHIPVGDTMEKMKSLFKSE